MQSLLCSEQKSSVSGAACILNSLTIYLSLNILTLLAPDNATAIKLCSDFLLYVAPKQ